MMRRLQPVCVNASCFWRLHTSRCNCSLCKVHMPLTELCAIAILSRRDCVLRLHAHRRLADAIPMNFAAAG